MSSKILLRSPMDLQLPPTPPMDLSDSSSNSSNDYKVSFHRPNLKFAEEKKIANSRKRKNSEPPKRA